MHGSGSAVTEVVGSKSGRKSKKFLARARYRFAAPMHGDPESAVVLEPFALCNLFVFSGAAWLRSSRQRLR